MMRSIDLISLSIVFSLAFASASFAAEEEQGPGGYFSKTSVEELSAQDESTFVVEKVLPESPAEQAGVLAGDRVLAVDGWRIYGYGEYSYVLSYLRPRPQTIALIVNRRDRILELELDEASIVAKIGVVPAPEEYPWIDLAERLGEKLEPEAKFTLSACSPRMALLAKRWLDEDASRAANVEWLKRIIRLRILLSDQRWDEALPIEEEIPIAELQRVGSFWNEVAKHHAAAQSIPDPSACPEGIDFFCFNYPLPRYVAPELGDFETNDPVWKDWLVRQSGNLLDRPVPFYEDGVFDPPEAVARPIDAYLARVKLSAVSPEWHSGWPYRYAGDTLDVTGSWQTVYDELQRLRKVDPKDRALYTYALAQMVLRQKDRCDESLQLLEELHGLSPFLAWRAADTNRHNVRLVTEDQETISRFDEWYESHRGRLAPRDDWPMRHLIARVRTGVRLIDPFVPAPYQDYSFYSPACFRSCIERKRPFDEEYEELKRDVVAKAFSTKREVLYRRLEEIGAPFYEYEDLVVLASIDRNRRSSGLLLDAVTRILEREAVRERDFTKFAMELEMVGHHFRESPGSDNGYARVYRELHAMDWTDREAATAQAERLYRLYGRLRATAEIAMTLRERGLDEAAQRYDDRLERYLDLTMPFANVAYPGWVRGYKKLGNAYPAHPKFAERMERALRQLERDAENGRFSDLEYQAEMEAYRAHCLVTMKRSSDAAAAIIRSYGMQASHHSELEFSFEGRTTGDIAGYRRWLIYQIVADPEVPQETRDRLLSLSALEAG